MTVSIKKVADKANVSTATVSHVINNTRYVANETKLRVMRAMKELDYIPNSSARSLRSQKTTSVGLILPDISNYFFTSVAEGIESVLKKNGFQLIVSNSNENLITEIDQLKMFNSQMVRGLIIASSARTYSEIESYTKKSVPIVFFDRRPTGDPHDFVSVENRSGTHEAINHLIEKGHNRIGMVTGIESLSSSKERLEGYKAALSGHNIPVDEKLIQAGDSKFQSGYDLAEVLHKEGITALFVANNLMTIGAMTYLKEHHVKIPQDIAIIGFDDYEWAVITNPSLSVIKQPSYGIGSKSAELLLDRIENPKRDSIAYQFPAELIIRDSC